MKCPHCRGRGEIPAPEVATTVTTWIRCPTCSGTKAIKGGKKGRRKKQ